MNEKERKIRLDFIKKEEAKTFLEDKLKITDQDKLNFCKLIQGMTINEQKTYLEKLINQGVKDKAHGKNPSKELAIMGILLNRNE